MDDPFSFFFFFLTPADKNHFKSNQVTSTLTEDQCSQFRIVSIQWGPFMYSSFSKNVFLKQILFKLMLVRMFKILANVPFIKYCVYFLVFLHINLENKTHFIVYLNFKLWLTLKIQNTAILWWRNPFTWQKNMEKKGRRNPSGITFYFRTFTSRN